MEKVMRYWLDIILMIIGLITAVAAGIGQPLLIIVFGTMTNSFVTSGSGYNVSTGKHAYYFIAIGFSVLALTWIQIWTFVTSSARQTARIRDKFFFAVLHQEMAWFDSTQIGTLNTRLTDDINTIHGGIGDKICIIVQLFSTLLAGIIIAFVHGWKLTLVILSVSPLLVASGAVWSYILSVLTSKELLEYSKAGAVAEEILSAIRTVVAFNGQKKAIERYDVNLETARIVGMKKTITTSISMGFSQFLIYGSYALAFWYGTKLTVDEKDTYDIGTVLIVFFSVLVGAFSIGEASPNLESVANARGAAYEVFKIITKPRPIDSSSNEGFKPDKFRGEIEFKNIHFSYPSRPDIQILKGLNLKIQPGKTIALVGSSGCGKSTTIQLLQRFYDPAEGQIIIDGHDIRTLNLKWMRENIGIVSQEPILFATTIAGNIRYGREDITDAEIEQAAKEANAYDFISKLPDKFNTMVGERGAQLSGGQKQRIAIARALARNPKILLLDEATSALDNQSESIVQAALDKAKTGRTTIVIAHRLSTIRTADIIAGFEKGVLIEQGTHDELMAHKGVYYALVMQQVLRHNSTATGSRLSFITATAFTLITAIIIAFVHGWQLTLLILGCIPIVAGATAIRLKSVSGHAAKDQKALEEAGRVSFPYLKCLAMGKYSLKSAPLAGLSYGITTSTNYFINAAVFRFGAWLITHCYMNFEQLFIVFLSVILGSLNAGQTSTMAPDFSKSKISAQRIFQLLDLKPAIDSYSEEGEKLVKCKGNVEFKGIHFAYPTRQEVQVLQGLDIKVNKGQTLALVGSSGCGKSTSIQLLERFYDPASGQVFVDGVDTKSLHIQWLRSQLGLVQQEPILFDCSIAENIQYGDNGRVVSQEEVEEAAKAANIHNFILSLPEKYNTRVGDKGAQLSGGQKQRIAIARALVRKPTILLLDEATSALDTESEKVVQKALDEARKGRTCIVIAHRLSTIQNSDIIAVIQNGKVIEQGTHSQLLALEGFYYTLVNTQVSH
uniref:ABC-type xenobiotic transporter n=1 Tax=Anolis carolinensis TaxID=28377 RepID=A0A803SUJ3_ANOCA